MAQDCRGRFDSEGIYYPWIQEVPDGLDTRKWIAKQAWCNGKIATIGGSYLGVVQWFGVQESSEYLTAMMPSVTPTDGWKCGDNAFYVNGAFQLPVLAWGFSNQSRTRQPTDVYVDWEALFRHLPLVDMDRVATGNTVPFVRDWIKHSSYDDYWRRISLENKFDQINVPVYNIAGWFDAYPASALRAFSEMRRGAVSERVRKGQKLLIGPWPHAISRSSITGEIDFGPGAIVDTLEGLSGHNVPEDLAFRWFDYWVKGIDNGIMNEPPIRIFVMGENVWRNENEWPLKRTQFTNCYLHSGGKANSLDGDGTLNNVPPAGTEPVDAYVYNPDTPVPTRGGNYSYSFPGGKFSTSGPYDQRPNERRDDVLVYTGEPLKEDLEVTGPLTCELFVSSSAPDTDFAVKLMDVYPDGRAINYSDGMLRMRYRDSLETPKLMERGKVYAATIEMFPTSIVFKKGHRIRVHVTSSDFPHFDRNPNTGHDFGMDAEIRIAKQSLHHDGRYPSRIVLPVIPRAR